MKQRECDDNDKVSRSGKKLAGRFDRVVLNSAYMDGAESLSFGMLLRSVDVCFSLKSPSVAKTAFIAMKAR